MAVLSVFRWSQFRDLVDQKKENLNSALGVQNYHLECNETKSWIKEKTKVLPGPDRTNRASCRTSARRSVLQVIESTQELGNDLAGVMALQRKLTGMERDLAAIEDKLADLDKEAERLASEHPEQAGAIRGRLAEITAVWDDMKVRGRLCKRVPLMCQGNPVPLPGKPRHLIVPLGSSLRPAKGYFELTSPP